MGAGHHHTSGEGHDWRGLRLIGVVAAGMVLSATGALRSVLGVPLNAVAAVLGGIPILWNALRELRHWRLSADLAVCVAAGAAVAIGQPFVAAEVILIMRVGGWLEALAVGRTRSAIQALVRLSPREATRLTAGRRERVAVDALQPGDRVAVAPGERVAVDGTVVAGVSTADQSALTGESLPVDVGIGSRLLAGSLNGAGPLEVVAERVGGDTAFQRMVHLVEEAEQQRAPAQRLADRCAAYFLPVVLACAGGVYLWSNDVVRAVAVLVVACPCALVLATPTAITAGVGRLARRGVLVKGGGPLEALGRSTVLLLDKTGTLTLARLTVADVVPEAGHEPDELLRLAAAVEQVSEHPVGRAIWAAVTRRGTFLPAVSDVAVSPGLGIAGTVAGQRVHVGSASFIEASGVVIPAAARSRVAGVQDAGRSVVVVAIDQGFAGLISVADEVRPEARAAVARLNRLYDGRLCLLTGDADGPAQRLAKQLGIRDVRSGLLPEDKTRVVAEFHAAGAVVAVVGDGVNDAAALTAADVGLAVTDVGTDVAVEAAGIALHGDQRLDRLGDAVVFARRVLRTIRQNLILFAGLANAGAVVVAGAGLVGPVAAALLHQVSSLLVVGNSLRLLWDGRDVTLWWARQRQRGAVALRLSWRPAVALAVLVYALSGVYAVRPGELGVVRRFGCPTAPAEPGLHYRLPWPATRLDRVRMEGVERIEVGFRSNPEPGPAPVSYEWNVQHREGRYRMVPEESLTTCGDQRFLEINAVVHFGPADPLRYLFAAADRPRVLQGATESAIGQVLAHRGIETVLTTERSALEAEILRAAQSMVRRLDLGVAVHRVHLQDVHPPLEVVEAYRRVVDAMEEKEAVVNRAEAYAREQVPLARGQAANERAAAQGFRAEAEARAAGDAAVFLARVDGRAGAPTAPAVADYRFYVEALEEALQGRRVMVVDSTIPGRTGLVLVSPSALPRQGARDVLREGGPDALPETRSRVAPSAASGEEGAP